MRRRGSSWGTLGLCLLLLGVGSLADNGIKVGMMTFVVFSQPAPKSVEAHYYKVGEPFTFLPGSIVDYLGVGGTMPVIIAFDMDREKIDWILNRVDGVIFASGQASLQGGYHDTLKFVVDWATKRNKQGVYFPILALGNGAEQLLQAQLELAGSQDSILNCSSMATSHMKAISATPELGQSVFWGKDTLGEIMKSQLSDADMFYGVECVIPNARLQAPTAFNNGYLVVAIDSNSNVAAFENKNLPFYGALFHPEKTLFERGEYYHVVDRSEPATELARAIVKRLVDLVLEKGNPKPYKKISNQVKQYFGIFRPSEYPATSEYERIYTFQRFHDGF